MKNWTNTVDCILETPVPVNTETYTAIPHSVFITEIKDELTKRGYTIAEERYLTSDSCQVMTCVYKVASDIDGEMCPAITGVNSYNKKRMASIRASALVAVCTNGMCGMVENGSYVRKHTGNALEEFREHIQIVIDGLDKEFARLVLNKEEMKSITLSKTQKGNLIGDMIMNQMIGTQQLSTLMKEVRKSQYPCFRDDTLWSFYNHVTTAYRDAHPLHFDKQHVVFHTYICDKFQLTGSRGLFDKLIVDIETPGKILVNGEDFEEMEANWSRDL